MSKPVVIIGAGLAGSEAALQLAARAIHVVLYEMRPTKQTAVHTTSFCAELVCSNSLKGTKPATAAGMQKHELDVLHSFLLSCARKHAVPAGGALAVDRQEFAREVTSMLESNPFIQLVREEVSSLEDLASNAAALLICTGPLTSDSLSKTLASLVGESLAFFDAAAPIVMADSLNYDMLFRQSRYEEAGAPGEELGDYLNAPFDKETYEAFIEELLAAERVMKRDFESKDLFQACQPIEEIARAGKDAPRFGPLKPVGLTDPKTGRRPWAALQLRAEDANATSYNLVGFQTNLKFSEQKRVFGMIPGLEDAVFARYGVMHRNTFIDAPRVLDDSLRLVTPEAMKLPTPVFVAGQLSGTEGYCEAMRSGLHAALSIAGLVKEIPVPALPPHTAFGALISHATDPETKNYQPMHVNFGIMPALEPPVKNKKMRYEAYAQRAAEALDQYASQLQACGLMSD